MSNGSDPSELFAISAYGNDFLTGRTHTGEQLLMGLLCPYVVVYFFSEDGLLLRGERRNWQQPAPRIGADGPYQIHDPTFQAAFARQLGQWQSELGFTPGQIRVGKFFDVELGVGIAELPEHLQDIDESDEDFEDLKTELQDWKASGSFVFFWAKDYFMSASGEVEST